MASPLPTGWLAELARRVKPRPLRVAFPEAGCPRVLDAAKVLAEKKLAHPVLIRRKDHPPPPDPHALQTIDLTEKEVMERLVQAYLASHDRDGSLTEGMARRLVIRPLMAALTLLSIGEVDAVVAGAETTTQAVVRFAADALGFAGDGHLISSFFLMLVPERDGRERPFIFADCAVNVEPTPEELAEIAVRAGRAAAVLLPEEPRVALLSFSTRSSADTPQSRRVRRAAELAQQLAPDLKVDGELQVDAAISPEVAARKVSDSPLVGRANVLVFPDLQAGNICYKCVQYLAGARVAGPILQGLRRPVSDLSRGAEVEEIIATTITLSALVLASQPNRTGPAGVV